METTPVKMAAGVDCSEVVPLPTWSRLFMPQERSVPSVFSARVPVPSISIFAMPVSSGMMTGLEEEEYVPSPKAPY